MSQTMNVQTGRRSLSFDETVAEHALFRFIQLVLVGGNSRPNLRIIDRINIFLDFHSLLQMLIFTPCSSLFRYLLSHFLSNFLVYENVLKKKRTSSFFDSPHRRHYHHCYHFRCSTSQWSRWFIVATVFSCDYRKTIGNMTFSCLFRRLFDHDTK